MTGRVECKWVIKSVHLPKQRTFAQTDTVAFAPIRREPLRFPTTVQAGSSSSKNRGGEIRLHSSQTPTTIPTCPPNAAKARYGYTNPCGMKMNDANAGGMTKITEKIPPCKKLGVTA
ncbi:MULTISPECIES: hypothetical protein [Pseudomonas putida group]|uniref:hypothetical protein n=1 Tax=Pseudomonas putida group TaxID=136845 RepID=UPI00240F695F|nr:MULTISPECIES: hypothetical protein [Pseudomonas putida group]WFG01122.1 hypothetical protein P3X84_18530 [Pseudomonas putida]